MTVGSLFIENSLGVRYSIDKSENFLYQVLKFCLFVCGGPVILSPGSSRESPDRKAVAKAGKQPLKEVIIP